MWVISVNGVVIYDFDGRFYYQEIIDKQWVYDIFLWFEFENYYYEVFIGLVIYMLLNGREFFEVELD